jgi:hypothetical protein
MQMKNRKVNMTNQTVLGKFSGTDSVCKTCKHLEKIEGRFFCNFLGAFLSEQTLYIPCDMKEEDPTKKSK